MNTLTMTVSFESTDRDPEGFDDFLDRVSDEFLAIRHQELDYGGALAKFIVDFQVTMPGLTMDDISQALIDLRTAIHAAGGGTPGWPSGHTVMGTSTSPADCDACV